MSMLIVHEITENIRIDHERIKEIENDIFELEYLESKLTDKEKWMELTEKIRKNKELIMNIKNSMVCPFYCIFCQHAKAKEQQKKKGEKGRSIPICTARRDQWQTSFVCPYQRLI